MRVRWIIRGLLCASLLMIAVMLVQAAEVVQLELSDIIHPISAEYLREGIEMAVARRADAVLIRLNTPGGLDTSMRDIIGHVINSKIPVIVYVSPGGSRAASAGFFILMSADWAVMAPGTNTGAAHPVLLGGGTIDSTMESKLVNDAAALLRSLVAKRGHNAEAAEKAVTESKSFTEREALEAHLIDEVASSTGEIFEVLDRRAIKRFGGENGALHLTNATVILIPMTVRQRFLCHILDPNVAFLLAIIGLLGLYIEFSHPGMILPGVAGALALVLALFAFHLLPINYAGVVLIVLALAMFVLEAKLVSHGVLAVGGIIAMVIGAVMLVRSPLPELRIHLSTALAIAAPFALITVFLLRLVIKARKQKIASGREAMIGAAAIAETDIAEQGQVLIQGERWHARAAVRIAAGTRVRVTDVDGLTLVVEPAAQTSSTSLPTGR